MAFAARDSLVPGVTTDRAVVRAAASDPEAKAALSRRLRSELDGAGLTVKSNQLLAANRRVLEDHLLMVASFLMVMAQLVLVVGGLAVASTMSLAVLERRREIGVLRAIGASHGKIHALIQIEGLTIAVLSWVLAIPLSLPLSLLLGRRFGRVMIQVPDRYLPDLGGLAWWLGLVVLVSLVACAWPARRATRVPVAEALSYE
jgi:putative ABC transport system permease protein